MLFFFISSFMERHFRVLRRHARVRQDAYWFRRYAGNPQAQRQFHRQRFFASSRAVQPDRLYSSTDTYPVFPRGNHESAYRNNRRTKPFR